jgi:hypothetical protein
MIAYFPSIITIVVCCLSWYLIRVNQNTDLKRQENRKLNRLVFNLLELKYWVDEEVDLDRQLSYVLDAYENEVIRQASDITRDDFKRIRVTIIDILKQQIPTHSRIAGLEDTIEDIIKELAEVDPVFAFELTGKYQLTVNTGRIAGLMEAAGTSGAGGEVSGMIVSQVLRPKMLKDLQVDLQINVPLIAKKAGKKIYKRVQELPPSTAAEVDKNEVSQFLKELVPTLTRARADHNDAPL